MKEKEIFSEVKCDYNNDEGYWCVDAWKTNKDDEEGQVIAFIHEDSGEVAYVSPDARWSPLVQEVIEEKVSEIRKENMKATIYRVFVEKFMWMDASDIERLQECIEDDVITDIEEAADSDDWHDGDVCIAIRRVLFKRLGIES